MGKLQVLVACLVLVILSTQVYAQPKGVSSEEWEWVQERAEEIWDIMKNSSMPVAKDAGFYNPYSGSSWTFVTDNLEEGKEYRLVLKVPPKWEFKLPERKSSFGAQSRDVSSAEPIDEDYEKEVEEAVDVSHGLWKDRANDYDNITFKVNASGSTWQIIPAPKNDYGILYWVSDEVTKGGNKRVVQVSLAVEGGFLIDSTETSTSQKKSKQTVIEEGVAEMAPGEAEEHEEQASIETQVTDSHNETVSSISDKKAEVSKPIKNQESAEKEEVEIEESQKKMKKDSLIGKIFNLLFRW